MYLGQHSPFLLQEQRDCWSLDGRLTFKCMFGWAGKWGRTHSLSKMEGGWGEAPFYSDPPTQCPEKTVLKAWKLYNSLHNCFNTFWMDRPFFAMGLWIKSLESPVYLRLYSATALTVVPNKCSAEQHKFLERHICAKWVFKNIPEFLMLQKKSQEHTPGTWIRTSVQRCFAVFLLACKVSMPHFL